MPCFDRAALKSDFSRPRHSTAWARLDICKLTSAVFRRPVGDLSRFGFFRLLGGYSRSLLTRMLLPFGMCLIVLMTLKTADYTEYELTLKLKATVSSVVILRLHCAFFFRLSFGQQLFRVFKFRKSYTKILEKCLPIIFQTSKLTYLLTYLLTYSMEQSLS